MKSIKLPEIGDIVYYISSEGFRKGEIQRVSYLASKSSGKEEILVVVKSAHHSPSYEGDRLQSTGVFKTLKELIDFYSKKLDDK